MSKADRLKHSRELVLLARSRERTNSGEWPVRMRGYYRALKREEEWAVRLSKYPPLDWMLRWIYRAPMMKEMVYNQNPFLSLIPKNGPDLGGKHFPVPIIFDKKD